MVLPAEYLDNMKALLGSEFTAYMESMETPRCYGLRLNRLKSHPGGLPFALEPVPWIENGFYYNVHGENDKPAKHPFYHAGLYYLQEPSAMTPASRLPISPGDKVLDVCAAPGGKSTEIGGKLQGSGVLLSNDISHSRTKALLKNIEISGIPNVCITSEAPHRLAEYYPAYFDKIILDAPCSGEGMFRKDPMVARSWTQESPKTYGKIQREILDACISMLRPGGYLMYSTCTFNGTENEGSVAYALETHDDLELADIDPYPGFAQGIPALGGGRADLIKCVRIFPFRMEGEGHFMALIHKRTDNRGEEGQEKRHGGDAFNGAGINRANRYESLSLPDREAMEAFFRETTFPIDNHRLYIREGKVYQLPKNFLPPAGLRIMRCGLLLGEVRKGRFIPSQALAMCLTPQTFPATINLKIEDERVIRYLKGETLVLEEKKWKNISGWALLCVEGLPLGFVKIQENTAKNKYLPGWRWQ